MISLFGSDAAFLKDPVRKIPKPLCMLKREVHVPYPKPRMAPITKMTYLGRGLKREETRSYMQSSDWTESTQRRVSENNGRKWSDWSPVPGETQSSGQFTQSGGASQGGSGPYDHFSGQPGEKIFIYLFELSSILIQYL